MRWIFIFLMVFPFILWGQNENGIIGGQAMELPTDQNCSSIHVEFMNQQPDSVALNSRLELGLSLPDSIKQAIEKYLKGKPHHREGLNPFVSWDIDIKAHFKQVNKPIAFTAIGFWYVEMNRNSATDSWNRLDTKLPFRIRYAPPQTGNWEVKVEVYIHGKLVYCSSPKKFIVRASNYKGNVTLNPKTKYLERGGETFIPTGINLPFPYNKNNNLWSHNPGVRLHLSAWEEYAQEVNNYISQGGEYFRMFLHPSSTGIEFEEVGNYNRRQNFAWEMDHLIERCEENNTLIQLDILYQDIFTKAGGYNTFKYDYSDYWDDTSAWPHADLNDVSGYSLLLDSKLPSDMFLKPLGIKYFKQRTRYIMARWGYSPSISMIELMSEPWHINENPYKNDTPYDSLSPAGDTARKAVYEYHKQISSYIKDSIHYNQRLLSAGGGFPSGSSAIYSHQPDEIPKFIDSTWYLDNIDVINISFYSSSPRKLLISKSNDNNECGIHENSMACAILRLENTYNKPVIFGESDTGDGSFVCSDYQGQKLDIMRYPFTGAIGHCIWATFIHKVNNEGVTTKDDRISWPEVIRAQNYFNSDDFLQVIDNQGAIGRQKERFKKVKAYRVETGYILGKDKEKGVGYIYNRTFNISTAANASSQEIEATPCDLKNPAFTQPIIITWKPQRLKVEGLKRWKKYKIRFYGYSEHKLIDQISLRSTLFGRLKLKHPPLVPKKKGTPLIWYHIEIEK